jgi:serine/threonine protein kinase
MSFADDEESYAEAFRNFKKQYQVCEVLGEGAYGKVFKVRCRQTGQLRALKQMKLGSSPEGVPCTAIREVAIMKALPHKNIVQLLDVFCKPGEIILVLELLDNDLKKHMTSLGCKLHPDQVRNFAAQLLAGIEFCHANRVIHRDLKPQNLLINSTLELKIADFGLARAVTIPIPQYTHEVVTLWYRPPEILLGSKLYSFPVDMWGVGCILDEMATGGPLFVGDSEIETVFKIFQKLGTPTDAIWPGVNELPDFKPTFPKWQHKGWANIRNTLAQVGPHGIDLLDKIMCYDPRTRLSARAALQHPYFDSNME